MLLDSSLWLLLEIIMEFNQNKKLHFERAHAVLPVYFHFNREILMSLVILI